MNDYDLGQSATTLIWYVRGSPKRKDITDALAAKRDLVEMLRERNPGLHAALMRAVDEKMEKLT